MAYTQLTPTVPSMTGTTVTLTAAPAGGDQVRPHTQLLVFNGSGASITVTVETGGTVDGYAIADQTVTVAAGAYSLIGPFVGNEWPQVGGTADGWVNVDYSAVTSVTRVAFQAP